MRVLLYGVAHMQQGALRRTDVNRSNQVHVRPAGRAAEPDRINFSQERSCGFGFCWRWRSGEQAYCCAIAFLLGASVSTAPLITQWRPPGRVDGATPATYPS